MATRAVEPHKRFVAIARGVSAVLLAVGAVMLVLGAGVLSGNITEGWGFPMSSVPNWGRPWGAVLMVAGAAYMAGTVLLFVQPGRGTVMMLIVCGLEVLLGTPVITTSTEILYNLFAGHDCQADWVPCCPDWIDSVWAYFMIANVVVLVALCRRGGQAQGTRTAPANPRRHSDLS